MVQPWIGLVSALAAVGVGLVVVGVAMRRRRRSPGSNDVTIANVHRADASPVFRQLRRRYHLLLGGEVAALSIVGLAAVGLTMRPVTDRQLERDVRNRDVMLCLDISTSMNELDAIVLREFVKLAGGLRGERIGLTIFNGSAITVFPLTDDPEFIAATLDDSAAAISQRKRTFVEGTEEGGGTSLIGDGLASCAMRFDSDERGRSRSIVFATDNALAGDPILQLPEAAALVRRQGHPCLRHRRRRPHHRTGRQGASRCRRVDRRRLLRDRRTVDDRQRDRRSRPAGGDAGWTFPLRWSPTIGRPAGSLPASPDSPPCSPSDGRCGDERAAVGADVRPPRSGSGADGRRRRCRDRGLDLDPARRAHTGRGRALVGDGAAPAARRRRPGDRRRPRRSQAVRRQRPVRRRHHGEHGGPRLQRGRAAARRCPPRRAGAGRRVSRRDFALVTFNSKTRVIVPWTTDRGALDSAVRAVASGVDPVRQGNPARRAAADDAPTAPPLRARRRLRHRLLPVRRRADRAAALRNRSSVSTTPSPVVPCSGTAPPKAPGCTCTSAVTRIPSCTSTTTKPAPTPCRGSTKPTSPRSPTRWASPTSIATAPSDVDDIADQAAGQVGTVYAGERDTVRRLYWLPAFGVIALVLWQFARTTLEIIDDRRALGRRDEEGLDVSEVTAERPATAGDGACSPCRSSSSCSPSA